MSTFASGFALQKLESTKQAFKKTSKSSELIHVLHLIQHIPFFAANKTAKLCDQLLDIFKSNDQYLIEAIFNVFDSLSGAVKDILSIIFNLNPAINDHHLVPAWVALVSKTCIKDHQLLRSNFTAYVDQIIPYFASDVNSITESTAQCLISLVSSAVSDEELVTWDEQTVAITKYLSETCMDLLQVKYRNASINVCAVIIESISKLKYRSYPLFSSHLELIGSWRSIEKEGFELNNVAEQVIAVSIANMGLKPVLEILPLNLTNSKATGRAWLLPLLRDNTQAGNSLKYFLDEVLPNVEFFEEKISHTSSDSINAKVFQTIVDQIWSIFPQVCYLPNDIEIFDDELGTKLGSLLFQSPHLRPIICHALKNLVQSLNERLAQQEDNIIWDKLFPKEKCLKDLEYVKQNQVSKILSTLFNVFSSMPLAQRGFVSETIETYLAICPEEELLGTFDNVCSLLGENLVKDSENMQKFDIPQAKSSIPKLSVTMMDLIILMAKVLPLESQEIILNVINQTINLEDVQLQKRAYKLLLKFTQGNLLNEELLESLIKLLLDNTCLPSSQITKLEVLNELIEIIPTSMFNYIPLMLPEVIISTKSNNDSTRSMAYQCLISLGHKFVSIEGQLVQNSEYGQDYVIGMPELIKMVSGGLLAQTPHMISAAVTCLSCLFYEFGQNDSSSMEDAEQKTPAISLEAGLELWESIILFLHSNNREIIKSVLGFIKVSVNVLPEDALRSKLTSLIPDLMMVNEANKNHFKSKMKHLIEKLIRKFGYEAVEECMPRDNLKLIHSLRKKANSSSNAALTEESVQETHATATNPVAVARRTGGALSAYDQVMNDSDSESEDEEATAQPSKNQHVISETNDAPLDLLDRKSMAKISTASSAKNKSKLGRDVKINKQGKLIFTEEDYSDMDDDDLLGKDNALNAYVEAVNQGPVRNDRNRLKWKKQKGDDGINWDDEPEQKKRPSKGKIGNSKVSKPKFKSKRKL